MLGPTVLIDRVLLRGGKQIYSNLVVFSLAFGNQDLVGVSDPNLEAEHK